MYFKLQKYSILAFIFIEQNKNCMYMYDISTSKIDIGILFSDASLYYQHIRTLKI